MPSRPLRSVLLLMLGAAIAAGCAGPKPIEDPVVELATPEGLPERKLNALAMIDDRADDPEALRVVAGMIWRPGYVPELREAAIMTLDRHDPELMRRTIRQYLPRMTAWSSLERICQVIAREGWVELSPALASSLGRPAGIQPDDRQRPEYLALAELFGPDAVVDVIFDLMVVSRGVAEQGLRTRCWDLLHRLGAEERLRELVALGPIAEDDLFMLDLHAAVVELGILPATREEILWVRRLCQPEYAGFWSEARAAVEEMTPERRRSLELRDLAIAVAAARHDRAMLSASEATLYAALVERLRGVRHHRHESNFDGFAGGGGDRLQDWRDELTWGDLAAMTLALRAMETGPVVAHLLDYAERDLADRSTEYGGILRLDEQGRYEVLEFPPRIRENDQKFIASQAMFDAGYVALFHFHFHAQSHDNRRYAGPGFGDVQYAEATRANCLVLTFVADDAMNVDFYRHGGVRVDLGAMTGKR